MPGYQAALLGWQCPGEAWQGFGSYPGQEQELLELWEVAGTFLGAERGGNWPRLLTLKPLEFSPHQRLCLPYCSLHTSRCHLHAQGRAAPWPPPGAQSVWTLRCREQDLTLIHWRL